VNGLVRVDGYEVREGLFYSKEHVWVKVEGGKVRIGVTDYAQKQLRELVFVELPSVGERIVRGKPLGSLESMKAVSDLVSPLSGTVEEVNEAVRSSPDMLNADPYGEGWLIVVSPDNLEEDLKSLMSGEVVIRWHKDLIERG
jgi:glycine cleavage system H protein